MNALLPPLGLVRGTRPHTASFHHRVGPLKLAQVFFRKGAGLVLGPSGWLGWSLGVDANGYCSPCIATQSHCLESSSFLGCVDPLTEQTLGSPPDLIGARSIPRFTTFLS
jgi:hypothetical protein